MECCGVQSWRSSSSSSSGGGGGSSSSSSSDGSSTQWQQQADRGAPGHGLVAGYRTEGSRRVPEHPTKPQPVGRASHWVGSGGQNTAALHWAGVNNAGFVRTSNQSWRYCGDRAGGRGTACGEKGEAEKKRGAK